MIPMLSTFTINGLTAVPEPALWVSAWLALLGVLALTRRK